MLHLYFHCAGSDGVHLDRRGIEIVSLAEARDHAIAVAQSVMASAYGIVDFSNWIIFVADEEGEEVLLVPFASALPTLH